MHSIIFTVYCVLKYRQGTVWQQPEFCGAESYKRMRYHHFDAALSLRSMSLTQCG